MSIDTEWILRRLESNVPVFQGLLRDVVEPQTTWKPSPEKWSLIEVINHLADEEIEDFGTRLRLLLEDPLQEWPPIDPNRAVVERQYAAKHLKESLDRFVHARRTSVAWLKGLEQPDWQLGSQLRAGELFASWLAHDLIHIRQINRLHYEFLTSCATSFSVAYAGDW